MSTAIEKFISVREAADARAEADAIFQRRYGQNAPDFPYHVLACYRTPDGRELPVCYIHFTARDEILLGGGACVDDRVVRRMDSAARAAVRVAGGLYRHALTWSVRHFAPRCAAIFGYCGDRLAERADLAVGFVRTAHPHLLAYWTRELPEAERARLIAQAHAAEPF